MVAGAEGPRAAPPPSLTPSLPRCPSPASLPLLPAQGDGCFLPRAESCAASYKLWAKSLPPPSSRPLWGGRFIGGFPRDLQAFCSILALRLQEKRPPFRLRATFFHALKQTEAQKGESAPRLCPHRQWLSRGLRPELQTLCPVLFFLAHEAVCLH